MSDSTNAPSELSQLRRDRPQSVKLPGWKWNINTPYTDSIEDLRGDFTERVPALIKEETDKTDLPFPPHVVCNITDAEVDFLNEVFQLSENVKFSNLTRIYYYLNRYFIESDNPEKAEEFLGHIEKIIDRKVPRAPLLFMIGRAFLAENQAKSEYFRVASQVQEGTLRQAINEFTFRQDVAKNKAKIAWGQIVIAACRGMIDFQKYGSSLFSVGNIKDWSDFLLKLASPKNADQPSPGKRIWTLLPPDIQALVGELASVPSIQEEYKYNIINILNIILDQRDFYQEQDFSNLTLPEEVQELLNRERENLSTYEVRKLNRLLIETAYPHEIEKSQEHKVIKAQQKTLTLFQFWGLNVTADALRQRKSRENRDGLT